MKRISGVLFFLFLWAGFLHAQTLLTNELNKLISSDPLLKTSEVGIVVHDLTAGKELYSYQADKLYSPGDGLLYVGKHLTGKSTVA